MFDPEHLKKLMDTNECERCNLSYADLSTAKLSFADLPRANLTEDGQDEFNEHYDSAEIILNDNGIYSVEPPPDG